MNIRGGGRDPSKSEPEPLDRCSSNLDSFFTTEISRWGAGARWLISESVDGGWILFAQASPVRLHTTPPPADRSAGFSPEIKSALITLPIQQPAASSPAVPVNGNHDSEGSNGDGWNIPSATWRSEMQGPGATCKRVMIPAI
jgi:hypothetical protein